MTAPMPPNMIGPDKAAMAPPAAEEAMPDAEGDYDCTCPKCGAKFTVSLPADAGPEGDQAGPPAGDSSGLDDAGGFSFARGK